MAREVLCTTRTRYLLRPVYLHPDGRRDAHLLLGAAHEPVPLPDALAQVDALPPAAPSSPETASAPAETRSLAPA